MTKLIEFKNHRGEMLRGLLDKADSNWGVLFIHGFERSTVERKFKNIVDELQAKVNMFRFDFSGCGLSDGSFFDMTVAKLNQELRQALELFMEQRPQLERIVLVAHSLASCIALKFLTENQSKVEKLILFGPGLNQKGLLRYYFVVSQNKDKEVTWLNYQHYLSEEDFQADIKKERRPTKEHYLSSAYFLENQDKDYQELFKQLNLAKKNILIVHGDQDDKVPLESNDKLPEQIKIIKVAKGDHDLHKVEAVKQYLDQLVDFILL